MRYAFAGDRDISIKILKCLLIRGHRPLALFVVNGQNASHSEELVRLTDLEKDLVFYGKEFTYPNNLEKLKSLNLDYIFGIHFPYIIPENVLKIPKIGFLNLHPAFLPYNKGWHTPSWSILQRTPYGATLHFMASELDKGDIIHQKQIEILPTDTADKLYKRTLALEEEVFVEAIPMLENLKPTRDLQIKDGTSHNKKDLKKIQKINLSDKVTFQEAIDFFRALTTNDISEAAYFEIGEEKFAVQIDIKKLNNEK
ncbi:formyltransferase family protein [Patiriisocius hiemis]|uniref:Formyltransferase family protein n=1 Tax=Patiriisocius hiemis TaxID=3075604 RepID=A0ABU2YF56_9FLAO|nr:formyltransferase family protein [Constantimarinum sp. W242]MDT0556647.1 formyltransferase family protein [Constantimarinum sp. W242]